MAKMSGFVVRLLAVGFCLGSVLSGDAQSREWGQNLSCPRASGSLPNPSLRPGTFDGSNPIQHIVVIMQENHSFDNYFGALNDPRFYGSQIDGVRPDLFNLDSSGRRVGLYHETNLCVADPSHSWNAVHADWDGGRLDGFVKTNDQAKSGARVMGFYGPEDLPFYYSLASEFAVGDRYFCSVLSQTYPNRFYLMAGTSFGHIQNDLPQSAHDFAQRTIFDELTQYGVSWRYYTDTQGYLHLFQKSFLANLEKFKKISDYEADLANGTLPQVVFLDSSFDGEDEHPDADVQVGEAWVAARVDSLILSSAWRTSALFLTYDENGGFYDHVVPPTACAPDAIPPTGPVGTLPGDFAHYGFRVPFVAVSPFVKHHYVSHSVYDHSSILKFIETKFNLPALTARDANADPFTDIFDYAHPIFAIHDIAGAPIDTHRKCDFRPVLQVPTNPVSIQSKKTGLCLEAGNDLHAAVCTGQSDQKFLIREDAFRTYQVMSTVNSLCLTADWASNQVFMNRCILSEDQGFDFDVDQPGLYYFAGWHGDFCFQGGALGTVLSMANCANDGSSDFILR